MRPAKGWPRRYGWSIAPWSLTLGLLVPLLWQVPVMQNVVWGYAIDPQFDRKEAVRLIRLALSIDEGDPDTLARACLISAFLVGDCEAEIEMADRAVELNPNSYRAWNCRGWVYKIAGRPEEAIRSFERAIRMSPVDPQQFTA